VIRKQPGIVIIYLCQDPGELLRCSVLSLFPLPYLKVKIETLRWR